MRIEAIDNQVYYCYTAEEQEQLNLIINSIKSLQKRGEKNGESTDDWKGFLSVFNDGSYYINIIYRSVYSPTTDLWLVLKFTILSNFGGIEVFLIFSLDPPWLIVPPKNKINWVFVVGGGFSTISFLITNNTLILFLYKSNLAIRLASLECTKV